MPESTDAFLIAEEASAGRLVLKAGGDWSIQRTLPALDEVDHRLEAVPARGAVQLDLSAVTGWDSSLVSVITAFVKKCQARGVTLETASGPPGIQQLAKMALAVPERHVEQPPAKEMFFTRLGKAGISVGSSVVEVFTFTGLAFLALGRLVRGRAVFRWDDTWLIVQRVGAEALGIVAMINFLIGVIVGFVGAVQLREFGATIFMATLVGVAMARELGCIMTGIIMSGRTGASFAAEIGSMKASQEIDALRTLGLSPMDFLVLPRLIAMVLMMPLLTIYGNVVGMIGGAVLAPGFGISFQQYYDQLVSSVHMTNYLAGVVKSFFFGAIVAGAGCLMGMQSGNSASAVGQATTSAVVAAITAIIALDAVFAFMFTALGI
jgi:phospholipid/cholesterol/gamma-HCH transport system permease protein